MVSRFCKVSRTLLEEIRKEGRVVVMLVFLICVVYWEGGLAP